MSGLWLAREPYLDLPYMRSEKYNSAMPLGVYKFESLPLTRRFMFSRGKGKCGGISLLALEIVIFGRAISDISELIFLIVTAFIYQLYYNK